MQSQDIFTVPKGDSIRDMMIKILHQADSRWWIESANLFLYNPWLKWYMLCTHFSW
jgi:hypothetical protein